MINDFVVGVGCFMILFIIILVLGLIFNLGVLVSNEERRNIMRMGMWCSWLCKPVAVLGLGVNALGCGCEVGDVFSYSLFYVVDEVGVVDLVCCSAVWFTWGFFEIVEFGDVIGDIGVVSEEGVFSQFDGGVEGVIFEVVVDFLVVDVDGDFVT